MTFKGQSQYIKVRMTVYFNTSHIQWGCSPFRRIRNRMANVLIRRRLTEIEAPGQTGVGDLVPFSSWEAGAPGGYPSLQGQGSSKKASTPFIAPTSSPSPRLRMSFHSPKSSARSAGATAPFNGCAQRYTAPPRGQELHPGHALLVQCSIPHTRITHRCKLLCVFSLQHLISAPDETTEAQRG